MTVNSDSSADVTCTLKLATYNMRGFNQGKSVLFDLCHAVTSYFVRNTG